MINKTKTVWQKLKQTIQSLAKENERETDRKRNGGRNRENVVKLILTN